MRKRIDFRAVTGTASIREVNENLTFTELSRAWLAATQNLNDDLRLRKWQDGFGDRVAWSLTTDEIADAAQLMLEAGYKPSSVNRDIGAIGSMFKWIIQARRAPAKFVSPTINIRRFEESIRVVDITSKDLQRLKDLALTRRDKRFGIFLHLLSDTGARKSELLERTWDDLNLDGRTIKLATSKNGKPRILHFTEETAKLIARFCPSRPQGALIFAGRNRVTPINYRTAWTLLTKEAGLPKLHMHDLRHDAARRLIVAGTPVAVAASIIGNSAAVLERRYAHLTVEDHRRAVEAAWRVAA